MNLQGILIWTSLSVVSISLSACYVPPVPTSHVLKYQEGLGLNDDLSLIFYEVSEDSRCPTGVDCIHAGRVEVGLMPLHFDALGSLLNLSLDPQKPELSEMIIDEEYRITLVAVEPAPVSTRTAEVEEYELKLLVAKL